LVVTAPSFTMSISPASNTVSRGGSAQYNLTLAAQAGFSGDVTLSASQAPTGLKYSFNPASVPGGNGNSTFTVQTTSSAKRGTITIKITGTGGGSSKTVSVTLKIQ
jgi:hypothetical protein